VWRTNAPASLPARSVTPPSNRSSTSANGPSLPKSALELCQAAIQTDQPKWDASSAYRSYIAEAKRRGLTEQQCAQLTGRF
jgi:hypothetical protein